VNDSFTGEDYALEKEKEKIVSDIVSSQMSEEEREKIT
jgi:hypothetical protein